MLEAVVAEQQAKQGGERNAPEQSFIRIARVKEISGLSKSTLLRWIKAEKFPRPVIEEGNSVLWDLAEVMGWRAEQFRKREQRIGGKNV